MKGQGHIAAGEDRRRNVLRLPEMLFAIFVACNVAGGMTVYFGEMNAHIAGWAAVVGIIFYVARCER